MATYMKRCAHCATPIDGDAHVCPSCGTTSPFAFACPTCKHTINKSQRVCPGCARPLWVHCPSCKEWTFVQDTCEHCGKGLLMRCPNERCGALQFFENSFCTECGQRFNS